LVVPVVLPAAWEYWSRDHIDVRAALWIAAAFAVGGFGGAWLRNLDVLPDSVLRLCFGLIMMYVAFHLIVVSDSEAARAAAGLTAVVLAWLGYLGLRALGRRTPQRPQLQEQIQKMGEQGHGGPDYHI